MAADTPKTTPKTKKTTSKSTTSKVEDPSTLPISELKPYRNENQAS